MSSIEIRVCGRYRLGEKIYKGKHSSVYLGKNVQSGIQCAIKCESKTSKNKLVLNQGKVLENLQGGVGIPNLYWFGVEEDFNFLVTDLLGNSLEDYFQICKRQFSLKTVLMIADQLLANIQYLHFKGYIHRDIKPQNFLVGLGTFHFILGKKLHQIYTIDYAFSAMYMDPNTKQHIKKKQNRKSFIGTLRYASINVHKGITQSRRDDLQAIGYMLIYFMKGELPWSNIETKTLEEKLQKTKQIKEKILIEDLCQGLPHQFQKYIRYCRNIQFDEKPDYSYLKRLFKQKFISEGYEYDYIYDWILIPLRLKDSDLSNRIPIRTKLKQQNESLSFFNFHLELGEELESCNVPEIKKPVEKKVQPVVNPPRSNSVRKQKEPTNQKKKNPKKQQCIIF